MLGVVDLCSDSDNDETSADFTVMEPQQKKVQNNIVVIDSSEDDEPSLKPKAVNLKPKSAVASMPSKEGIIVLDSSSDDDDDDIVATTGVARKPASTKTPSPMNDDDDDYDSSDDEADMQRWAKQRANHYLRVQSHGDSSKVRGGLLTPMSPRTRPSPLKGPAACPAGHNSTNRPNPRPALSGWRSTPERFYPQQKNFGAHRQPSAVSKTIVNRSAGNSPPNRVPAPTNGKSAYTSGMRDAASPSTNKLKQSPMKPSPEKVRKRSSTFSDYGRTMPASDNMQETVITGPLTFQYSNQSKPRPPLKPAAVAHFGSDSRIPIAATNTTKPLMGKRRGQSAIPPFLSSLSRQAMHSRLKPTPAAQKAVSDESIASQKVRSFKFKGASRKRSHETPSISNEPIASQKLSSFEFKGAARKHSHDASSTLTGIANMASISLVQRTKARLEGRNKRPAPSPPPQDAGIVALGREGNVSCSRLQSSIEKHTTTKPSLSTTPKSDFTHKRDSVLKQLSLGPDTTGVGDSTAQGKAPPPSPRSRPTNGNVESTALREIAPNDGGSSEEIAHTGPPPAESLVTLSLAPDENGILLQSPTKSAEKKAANARVGLENETDSSVVKLGDRTIQQKEEEVASKGTHTEHLDDSFQGLESDTAFGDVSSGFWDASSEENPHSLESLHSEGGETGCARDSDASSTDCLSSSESDLVDTPESDGGPESDTMLADNSPLSIEKLHVKVDSDHNLKLLMRSTKTKHTNYRESSRVEVSAEPRERPKTLSARKDDADEVPRRQKRKRNCSREIVYASPRPRASETEETALAHIEHLEEFTYDELGRPTYKFSVLGLDDTMIFDLAIAVEDSTIEGAGLGAHLTFKGARKLRPGVQNAEPFPNESIVVNEEDLMLPLEAAMPSGRCVSVSLAGAYPRGKSCQSVLGKHHHSEGVCPHSDGVCPKIIGFGGMFAESEYVPHPEITELSFRQAVIEIGRYGPVKKTDRLRSNDYTIKSFIYCNQPEVYGFDVEEPYLGNEQVVDITDNATGLPHSESRKLIPSYINEVGHSVVLKPNVHAKDKDGRYVDYYLDLKEPLKKDVTVELFANYDQHYEQVRERKGYGLENLENGMKSDEHEATALARNFEEREFVTEQINHFSYLDIYYTLEFVIEKIQEPIVALIDEYVKQGQASARHTPTSLQLRARLRLNFLSDVFLARISALKGELRPGDKPPRYPPAWRLLRQAKKWAKSMRWLSFARDLHTLKKRGDVDVYDTLIRASRENVLWKLQGKIEVQLDESMWSPAAVQLVQRLCRYTVVDGPLRDNLATKYLKSAKKYAKAIREACQKHRRDGQVPDELVFASALSEHERLDKRAFTSFQGFKDRSFFRKHTLIPKGVIASLIDMQCYFDALNLAGLPDQASIEIVPTSMSKDQKVIIADGRACPSDVGACVGYPRHISHFTGPGGGRINEKWYILWQVVFVVHCFAEEFLAPGDESCSLEKLCDAVDVDVAAAEAIVEQGIDTTEFYLDFAPKDGRGSRSSNGKASSSPASTRFTKAAFERTIWKALEDLNWTLDIGKRPTDYYFLPPGVRRHAGFSSRKDYFDSAKQVLHCIETHEDWKNEPTVAKARDLYKRLLKQRAKWGRKDSDIDTLMREDEAEQEASPRLR